MGNSALCIWAHCHLNGPSSRGAGGVRFRGDRNVTTEQKLLECCALEMGGRGPSQGIQTDTGAWERRGSGFSRQSLQREPAQVTPCL